MRAFGANVRFERRQFFCGTKPCGGKTMKNGWVAILPNGKVVGDETVDRGLYGNHRWEPRYPTRADVVEAVGAK